MQIIIPMSGFGERFRRAGYAVPKPLIEVGGKPIIEHVVNLFPGETDVTFVCNRDHLAEPSFGMRALLERCCPTGRIVAIAPHKLGPVNAVMQAASEIADDRPVIVNYCDFACYWDYQHFCRFVEETHCDGAIPAYRGFHPHSLGSTHYAYLREANGWASAIQEKKPFTQTPMDEFASSGTYYFRSGALMKEAFSETIARGVHVNGEHYASLAYIPLFERGARIAVYELQHFMQWGTPDDLTEYLQYDRQFRALMRPEFRRPAKHGGTLLLPMAGAGSRFVAEGYALPKPLIEVSGRAMAVAAASDLPVTPSQICVLRRDLPCVDDIAASVTAAFPSARIVMLDNLTEGQAVTCLKALDGADPHAPLTIGACDTGLLYDANRFEALFSDDGTDVVVWGFRGHDAARRNPQGYGWIHANGDKVLGVSVKQPLGDPKTDPVVTGAFTFKRAGDFRAAAERMIMRGGRVGGEFYVDTCINDAVELGLKVRLFDVEAYLCWGTPNELRTFEYWQSCFHKWAGHPYSLSGDARVPLGRVDEIERRYATKRPQTHAAPLRNRGCTERLTKTADRHDESTAANPETGPDDRTGSANA
jgi:NDP-sugar pyrophosphorylase family protein